MPIIKSAIKRAKQTIKRRERNVATKRGVKTAVNSFTAKPSAKSLSAAYSELDTAVKKGLLKKNTAARRKMQLSKIAKNARVTTAASTKKAPAIKAAPAKTTVKKVATKKAVAKKAPAKKTTTKKPAAKKIIN